MTRNGTLVLRRNDNLPEHSGREVSRVERTTIAKGCAARHSREGTCVGPTDLARRITLTILKSDVVRERAIKRPGNLPTTRQRAIRRIELIVYN